MKDTAKVTEQTEALDEVVEQIHEEFSSKEEEKAIKKVAKALIKDKNQIDLSHIEHKIMSRREQILLVQTYFKTKFWRDLAWLTLAAFLVTIAFDYFISSTGRVGLFPAGIGAIARFFAIWTFKSNTQMQSSFYFIYYFAMNIPLFIFGYIKLGKKFTYTTILFIGLQIAFDQILQLIPVVNPNSFHFIVNYKLLSGIQGSWNSGIWLFIFGTLGGVLVGSAYALVYKIGSSTGGSDFFTMYFSNIKNKPIGTLNRNVNFIILALVIVLNTAILPVSMVTPDVKVNILQSISVEDALKRLDKNNLDLVRSMLEYAQANRAYINGNWDPQFLFNLGINSNIPDGDVIQAIWDNFNTAPTTFNQTQAYQYLVQFVCKDGYGDVLPLSIVARIKLAYIFGPSLFSSIALVLCSAVATNTLYPKYKARTYLITTNKPKEINKILLNKGFQNDILTWEATNRINKNYLHRSVLMVAMSVMSWDLLEKDVFLADPQAKINILKTKDVKGIFNYEIKTNDERDVIHRKVSTDDAELEKIRQIAIVKYNKEHKRKIRKKQKKSDNQDSSQV
ncbi:YitT family ABC transporter [Spiroplasma clarkii]|uniref:YitT family protein n=1 Tax=Spiroplasma clarkii TaxID=2139 RepID=A0A2K8KH96_9MOLU|nr:YitT family ABC transporter [Spiroplasma clarkii]ATX71048.1 hypothetical protein SCLAR_v1c07310 [Spiroplasma clarkii]